MLVAIEPQLRQHLNHIFTIARDNDEGAVTNALHHMLWLHCGNGDTTNNRVHVATGPQSFALQAVFDNRQCWVREDLAIRKNPEERDPVTREPLLKEAWQLGL